MRYACFDIGSGMTKLQIVETDESQIKKILDTKTKPILLRKDLYEGETPEEREVLSPCILKECKETIADFMKACDKKKVPIENIFAFATEVFRIAKNGAEFLREIKKDLNLSVGLVDQALEAKIGFNTALAHLSLLKNRTEINEKDILVLDIGGGSFQVSNKEGPVFMGQLGSSVVKSYLAEIKKCDVNDALNPVTEEEQASLQKRIMAYLKKIAVDEKLINMEKTLVSIGEYASPFAALQRVREIFDADKIKDEQIFQLTETDGLIKKCLNKSTTFFEENKVYRSESVVAKLTFIRCVMEAVGIREFRFMRAPGGCTGYILLKLHEVM